MKDREIYRKLLTIYGRNIVLEALTDESLEIFRLHLSDSNRPSKQLQSMEKIAKKRGIEIKYHSKKELSFISKNAKQDQGVALDIVMKEALTEDEFLDSFDRFRLLAVDRVHNPQNLGLIIRSATAGNIDAILLPSKKGAPLVSPLTIKASAGTLFKIPIIRVDSLYKSLLHFKENSTEIYTLSSYAKTDYRECNYSKRSIFVLGNESEGVSKEIEKIATQSISIPMRRGVESLNVAMSATLVAFL